MLKILLFILLFHTYSKLLSGQQCDCQTSFLTLVDMVEKNYVGFPLFQTQHSSLYNSLKSSLLNKAKKTDPKICLTVLDEYISLFNDNHFGITKNGNKSYHYVKDTVKNYIPDYYKRKLSGFWYNKRDGLLIKITENKGSLCGVVLTDKQGYSKKNDTLFRIFYDGGNKFDLYYFYHKYFYQCVYKAELKNNILDLYYNSKYFEKIPGGNVTISEENLFENTFSFKLLDENTSYISIPSFFPSEITVIDSALNKNDSIIKTKKNFIIDLRNNRGGSIEASYGLIKYLYTNPVRYPEAYDIATESSIADLESILEDTISNYSEDLIKYATYMVKEMKNNMGKIIKDTSALIKKDSILKYPQNVAIIINSKTASSAELFLFAARQSKKVKLLGTNSAGTVDFGWPTPFAFCENTYKVVIPAQMAAHTPTKRYYKIGISPDIKIPEKENDWVLFVRNYLNKK